MFGWYFLILQIIITDITNGQICGDSRIFTNESLREYCTVNENTTPEDEEALRRVAADISYGQCIKAYGYIAVLDNPQVPNFICVGAIINPRWILDNCIESPKLQYKRIKVGEMMYPPNKREYRIERTVQHENYKRAAFDNHPNYHKRYLFAATDALYLRRTANSIMFPTGTCAIRLFKSSTLPSLGAYAVYMNATGMRSIVMRIMPNQCCNNNFRDYFTGQQMCLTKKQFCVNSRRMKPSECCHSQALMIASYSLLGVMAWSTPCPVGGCNDPWVFSSVYHYLQWIKIKSGVGTM